MKVLSILPPLALYASSAHAKNYSLPDGNFDEGDLLGRWWNHNDCYYNETEGYNVTTLLEQETELVPKGVIFLGVHECEEVERTGTIPVGTRLVVLPIVGDGYFDVNDDFNSSLVEDCPARDSDQFAEDVEEDVSFYETLSNYAKEPFATVNGETLETIFTFSDKEFFYSACPIDPDKEICDECDINFQPPEGCDAFTGTDRYPVYAWWAADETEWKSGETRTYNYGATLIVGPGATYCLEATYTLTAEETATEEPTPEPTSEPGAPAATQAPDPTLATSLPRFPGGTSSTDGGAGALSTELTVVIMVVAILLALFAGAAVVLYARNTCKNDRDNENDQPNGSGVEDGEMEAVVPQVPTIPVAGRAATPSLSPDDDPGPSFKDQTRNVPRNKRQQAIPVGLASASPPVNEPGPTFKDQSDSAARKRRQQPTALGAATPTLSLNDNLNLSRKDQTQGEATVVPIVSAEVLPVNLVAQKDPPGKAVEKEYSNGEAS